MSRAIEPRNEELHAKRLINGATNICAKPKRGADPSTTTDTSIIPLLPRLWREKAKRLPGTLRGKGA